MIGAPYSKRFFTDGKGSAGRSMREPLARRAPKSPRTLCMRLAAVHGVTMDSSLGHSLLPFYELQLAVYVSECWEGKGWKAVEPQ